MQQLGLPTTITKEFDSNEGEVLTYILNKPKMFRAYNNEDKQKLGVYLVAISQFLGIKEPLSDIHRKLLVNSLCSEMPTFTYEELNKAIQMAAMGRFENVDNNHYQHLSPQYISNIINAYKKYRGITYQKYRRLQDRLRRDSKPKNISEKESFYMGLELVEVEFNDFAVNEEQYCDSEYRMTQIPHIYSYLIKHKVIRPKEFEDQEGMKNYIISWFRAISQKKTTPRMYITKMFNIPPNNQ
jgi:hypothetical protein